MEYVGVSVSHKKYGEGKVVGQSKEYLSVKFKNETKVKKFPYPSCIDKGFLSLAGVGAKVTIRKRHSDPAYQGFNSVVHFRVGHDEDSVLACPFDSIDAFCNVYIDALEKEIQSHLDDAGKKLRVFDGVMVSHIGSAYVYTFESEEELNLPVDISIDIWKTTRKIPGTLLSCDGFIVSILSNEYLGKNLDNLEFSTNPVYLLEELQKRLESLQDKYTPIVKDLIMNGSRQIVKGGNPIVSGQANAIRMAPKQEILFVWGPPGTGKTYTLAQIASEFIRKGHRVLMVSQSNIAVDGAILALSEAYDYDDGEILRYGYPHDQELRNHSTLTSYNYVLSMNPKLQLQREELFELRKKVGRKSAEYVDISQKLHDIRTELGEFEASAIGEARFVATTISKAICDFIIFTDEFDVVLFDEASMASVPQVVHAASLANKHFICFGDFRQLPPIVKGMEDDLLKQDIFDYCGIEYAVNIKKNHKWLCVLREQRRMHKEIADVISKNIYSNYLFTSADSIVGNNELALEKPLAGRAIGLLDLSGMMSVCSFTNNHSKVNILSALVTAYRACDLAGAHDVGIITPYRAQARLLFAICKDIKFMTPSLREITCSTVHSFQGREKDFIFFDTVDCYRSPRPGLLLYDKNSQMPDRLLNVAMTRAKGKFITVANADYYLKKIKNRFSLLREVIDKSEYLLGDDIFKENESAGDFAIRYYSGLQGVPDLLYDLKCAEEEVGIDIPDAPQMGMEFDIIISALEKLQQTGVKVTVRKEGIIIKLSATELKYDTDTRAINPLIVIDKKIVWYGLPASKAFFKTRAGDIPTSCRPVFRIEGQHTARYIRGLMKLKQHVSKDGTFSYEDRDYGYSGEKPFVEYVTDITECPICGSGLNYKTRHRDHHGFLGCSRYPFCRHTEDVDMELVDEYMMYRNIRCKVCDARLAGYIGKYGVYVKCPNCQQSKTCDIEDI